MDLGPSKIAADELPEGFTLGGNVAGESNDQQQQQQQQQQQMEEQRRMILEQACTQEALARLGRIRMVRESKAKAIENSIVSMALAGKLPMKIDEAKMIEILERGIAQASGSQEGQISIQRKKYAFDSDDENEDDDDL
jgi:programmed cell death protein 5